MVISKKNLVISILSGLLLGLSFPPFNIGFLAWIFLIPLIHIYYSEVCFKEKILSFYTASFVSHAIITHWVALNSGTSMQVAIFSYLALCFFYSFYWVLYLILVHISIKNIFFDKEFVVSKLSDRMGMRLDGPKIENIVDTNIKSEGLIKGVIQVPADGNPIIMLSDHGTIGGYPKIGVVISADYDKLVQLTPGSKIKFQEVELSSAETLFKLYDLETQNLISQI